MADVRHKDARRPVEPNVPGCVENLEVFRFVPHNRRLTEHRPGLIPFKPFENWHRRRGREIGDDAAKICSDLWNSSRLER